MAGNINFHIEGFDEPEYGQPEDSSESIENQFNETEQNNHARSAKHEGRKSIFKVFKKSHHGSNKMEKLPLEEVRYRMAYALQEYLHTGLVSMVLPVRDTIISLIPPGGPNGEEMYIFANLVVEFAKQIPYNHPSQIKLIDLLRELSRSSKTTRISVRENNEETLWKFEVLKEVIRDNLTNPAGYATASKAKSFVNYSAFLAHMTSAGLMFNHSVPFALSGAFESEPEHEWEREFYVAGAAQWILWAGQYLFDLFRRAAPGELQVTERKTDAAIPGSEPALTLYSTFTLARWHAWRDGFEAASVHETYGEECKNLAHRAHILMVALETAMLFEYATVTS